MRFSLRGCMGSSFSAPGTIAGGSLLFVLLAAWAVTAQHTPSAAIVFSAAGVDQASITPARDAFRTNLGGGTVPGANGSFGGVRREINWDGVPAGSAAPNNLTANFFNSVSPRGVVFSTPGTGFQVSGATSDVGAGQPAAANFGNIDATYTATFGQFTAQRLFTPLGSNVVDVNFFVPGTATPALVTGFGSVFTDVDLANTTSITFFDSSNNSLGTFFVPAVVGSQTFSFLGVSFGSPVVSRVRILAGNTAVATGASDQNGVARDVVVMDDFIYGEPTITTAARVAITGRVLTGDGSGLRNAVVSLRQKNGQMRTVVTSAFGYFTFTDVEIGSYVLGVSAKHFSYRSRVLDVTDLMSGLDIYPVQ